MNDNIKKVAIPFIVLTIVNLSTYHFGISKNFSVGISPDMGLVIIPGLLFGPYGALGTGLSVLLCDIIRGYKPLFILVDMSIFAIPYLAYKIWYTAPIRRTAVTKPRLNSTSNVILFLTIIIICSMIDILIMRKATYLIYPEIVGDIRIGFNYFVNMINFSIIFGGIGIWLFKRSNLVHTPKRSPKHNERFYNAIAILIILSIIAAEIIDSQYFLNPTFTTIEIIYFIVLVCIYLTRPISAKIEEVTFNSIPESVMDFFYLTAIFIAIIGIVIASNDQIFEVIEKYIPMGAYDIVLIKLLLADVMFIIFFVPALAVLNYIENKVITPIVSFSKIENSIKKGYKIESKDLTGIYAEYLNQNDEIGMLARSFNDLINYINEYIENIRKNEIENEKNETELKVAERIHKSILPTECMENEDYTVYGISKPAKEIGGDFYDYYQLDDDNLVIMIGDASGKGVPAALLSTTTQSVIRQMLKIEKDPAKILYSINNQLCENNPESMFLTLWLGIYNNKTKILTFSSAGHPAPLIIKDEKFESLKVSKSLILGVMENYEYTKEEVTISKGIIAYTDGITDARNQNKEFYGKDRLINYLNNHPFESKIVTNLLNDINEFSGFIEQFDDMTIVLLDRHN